jgi:FPC/CPF motif-containing protein YcgG
MPAPSTPLYKWQHDAQQELEAMMHSRVAEATFPCVGAKAALAKGTLHVLACNRIDSGWDDLRIHDGLLRFAEAYKEEPALFRSFAVVFEGPEDLSEAEFEAQLWKRAQSISDKDVWRGQSYDDNVSHDPESPHFSLSFGGEAFFIVGLHPNASRPARRFPRPTMVFNLHDQFETLRAQNKYENMREKIMVRDEAIAGTRNPMLSRHGETSEARQYSGRVVDEDWKCPFHYAGTPK